MDIGSILLLLSVLLLVAFLVGRPLLETDAEVPSQEELDAFAIWAERDRILDALEELDFDHRLGKISKEEYPLRRQLLMKEGAEVLKTLDLMEDDQPVEGDPVEAAIAERRAASSRPAARPVAVDDEIESLIAARRREKTDQSGGFCPQCGQAHLASDRFCSKCGAALA